MATIVKRSGRYQAQVRLKAGIASKSFPATKEGKKEAKEWAAKREDELKRGFESGNLVKEASQLTLRDLINRYEASPKARALRSFDDNSRSLAWFASKYGATRLMSFGAVQILDAQERLVAGGRAPATVNRILGCMRMAWRWGRRAGLLPTDRVWPDAIALKEPPGRVRYLSDSELAAVFAASQKDALLRAAITVSLATGVRQGELLRLTWQDVDLTRGTLTVHVSKSGRRRAVHLGAAATAELQALRKRSSVVAFTGHVFTKPDGTVLRKSQLKARWGVIRSAAGLKDFVWHDLRHTCASILAQNGASLLEIASVLGHTSPQHTMRYSHLVAGAPVTGHAALDAKLKK